jgi:hypothetical protein
MMKTNSLIQYKFPKAKRDTPVNYCLGTVCKQGWDTVQILKLPARISEQKWIMSVHLHKLKRFIRYIHA